MLSGIANLIFGATPTDEETTAKEVNLKVTPVENEWTLVDKEENDCGDTDADVVVIEEHPSMSVYITRGQPGSDGDDSASESSSIQELEPSSSAVQPHSTRNLSPGVSEGSQSRSFARLVSQLELKWKMELCDQKKAGKKLSKNKLDRNNKAYLQRRHTRRRQVLQQPKSAGKRRC